MALNTAQLGNSLYNIGARDSFFYGASTFPSKLPTAISLLSSNVLHPLLLPEEVEGAKSAALYETQVMWSSAKQVIPEIVLQTAFRDNTLGMPSALSEEQAGIIGEKELRGYLKDWFRPERMVVTGLGMPHEELVELVSEHFEAVQPLVNSASGVGSTGAGTSGTVKEAMRGKGYATVSNVDMPVHSEYEALSGAVARYTGGEQFIEKDDEQFTHLAIAFEAPKVTDPDVVSGDSISCLSRSTTREYGIGLTSVHYCGDATITSRRLVLLSRWTWKGNVLAAEPKRPQQTSLGRHLSIVSRRVQRFRSFRYPNGCGAKPRLSSSDHHVWPTACFDGGYDGWCDRGTIETGEEYVEEFLGDGYRG